jgi:hypothetical protein
MIKSIICRYSRKVGIDKDLKGQLRWLPSEEGQIHGLWGGGAEWCDREWRRQREPRDKISCDLKKMGEEIVNEKTTEEKWRDATETNWNKETIDCEMTILSFY